ncbi:MAG TPA: DUF4221 family protein [Macellibacteroides fermentans]|uniref:DUF4221 family protein n=1 Tax=Macellibacteroides fermentans TaxID=879969 RepID=UPI002CD56CC8|nr:DUF4221 family protein [Macellibacteroides fermentans]
MKLIHFTSILEIIILFFSCNDINRKPKSSYVLEETESRLVYQLDGNTRSFILALFVYKDCKGKEYLTFQSQGQNKLFFYDMNSCKLEFTIKPEMTGPNGIGRFLGYYIHNTDSIFLTSEDSSEIILINHCAILKDKFQYKKTSNNILLSQFYSTSFAYQPIVLIGNKMYIISGCNRWTLKNPISAVINISDKSIYALPFSYPHFIGANNKQKRAGVETFFSRCFDGKQFIYSFYYDENIYITSLNHDSIRQIKSKSKLIDKIVLPDDYDRASSLSFTLKKFCEEPNYGNMYFDKYRNVYYRIAYPKTKIENEIDPINVWQFGRKIFSIIILDKDFNIIGETVFPKYTYNSKLIFVREDGIYIGENNSRNSKLNDNFLSFKRFVLLNKC